MITGYNSDVRHGSRTYHVQTEDKGLANPRIETLIYVGGEILDSTRSSYEDLLDGPEASELQVQLRMDQQHRAVIQGIRNGKYDVTPPDHLEPTAFNDRTLVEAILDHLAQEGEVDTLELVLDRPLVPAFGAPFRIEIQARLCHSRAPVVDAEVVVKLVSGLRRTTPLAAGRTDAQGRYSGEVALPLSQPGHCAVVISCSSPQGADEWMALVTPSGDNV